jgi:hypothetical protein
LLRFDLLFRTIDAAPRSETLPCARGDVIETRAVPEDLRMRDSVMRDSVMGDGAMDNSAMDRITGPSHVARGRMVPKALTGLLLALGLMLGACGGGEAQQRTADWQPHQRIPRASEHWWWTPVERACQEDGDCDDGESCQPMRLGTCEGCPRGETARVCVGEDESQESRQASSR